MNEPARADASGAKSAVTAAPSQVFKRALRDAFVMALGYWVVAGLWVAFSDRFISVEGFAIEVERMLAMIKGQAFVFVTAILLFLITLARLQRLYSAEQRARRRAVALQKTVDDVVFAMSNVVKYRDPYTAGHEKRVSLLASAIARRMGLPEERVHALELVGLVHDIGKVGVPSDILARPRHLEASEFDLVRQHSQIGHDIIAHIDFGFPAAEAVLQHHERLDGSGYPRGLKGKQIIEEARILAVADVAEAMMSYRPYRPSNSSDDTIAELQAERGKSLDPTAVDACVELLSTGGFEFVDD